MKKFIYIINFIISFVFVSVVAMEQSLTFYKATQSDVMPILKVINEQAVHDNTKIVILPKNFRQIVLEDNVSKSKLYCVKQHSSDEIIAFKKLFIISDEKEYDDVVCNEIRCHGEKSNLIDAYSINEFHQKTFIVLDKVPQFTFNDSLIVYFGSDYTVPSYRNQGINSQLTRHAFEMIKEDVNKAIQIKSAQKIVLLYGLTKANAGQTADGVDRTPSIIRAFMSFIKTVAAQNNYKENNVFYHNRYESFMPTFDPEDIKCKPLSDGQAIPGYGNVLLFPLIKK